MFKKSKVCSGVLIALGGALLVGAAPSWAQDGERIEITGSRIKSIGNTSSSPITSVGKADIEISQPVAVEELVRGLPSAYPAIGPNLNNGSTGIASIDLRGMGSNRTLVLFNGKRFVPANLGGVVDTNNVPVSLLERVDLVTGGASAVYGADAVAGVVNFVTKRNFTGVEATSKYTVSGKNDARRYANDLTLGANLADGRGNVALHVGTSRTAPLRLGDRDYSGTVISSVSGAPGGYSATAVPAQWSGLGTLPALNGQRVIDETTGLLRATVPPLGNGPPDGYNTNPPNYFETPLTRTQVTALGRFSINEYAEAYAEIFHTKSNVTLNLAPSGTFNVALNIPIGNPYITAPVRQQLCTAYGISAANCVAGGATEFRANIARRFVEAGPRVYSYDNTTTQYTVGLRGSIPFVDSWSYDGYYQSGKSNQLIQTGNGFSSSKLQQAVRALNTTTCTVNSGGCVPVNLFGAAGTISPAMLNYLSTPTFATTEVEQDVISLSANGEVGFAKSPFAKQALGMAVGVESRRVLGANKSDAVIQTQGELLGSGAPTPDRTGELKFNEVYGELTMPLVQDVEFIKALNVEGGFRQTEFKTSAGVGQRYGSWKAGADWSPVKGLRFRGEQQRATRAPNVNELYQPVTTGLATLTNDPCQGTQIGPLVASDKPENVARKPALTALCQQTGVPAAQVGNVAAPSSNQVNNTAGGNPNLGPEKADTTTLGIVWEPDFVSNLSISLDFWKIKVKEAVSSPTSGQVFDGCYSPALNPGASFNALCQLIQRDPLNGGLNGTGSKGVTTQSSNLGAYDYSGVDLGINYRLPLKDLGAPTWGRVDLGLQLSMLDKADIKSLPSLAAIRQAGRYGVDVGNPYPKTRFSQKTTWTVGDFTLAYNWRYVGGSSVQDPLPLNTTYQDQFSSLPAVSYVDLSSSWQALKNLKLSITVNNAFDKQPPQVGTGIGPGANNFGNTFPQVYDVIGRRFVLTAQATF
jgi:iron complex outermembrane recepter protein